MSQRMLVFLVFFMGTLHGEEKNERPAPIKKSFFHVGFSSGPYPLPIPSVSFGYRKQSGHIGSDYTLRFSTVYYLSQAKLSSYALFYLDPDVKSQLYVGVGLGGSFLLLKKSEKVEPFFAASPEFLLGKEYVGETGSKRFIQVEVSIPTYNFGKTKHFLRKWDELYIPLIVVTYGLCF